MAKCKHCIRRKSLNRPPCKDHRIGLTMEGNIMSRNGGVVSSVLANHKEYDRR